MQFGCFAGMMRDMPSSMSELYHRATQATMQSEADVLFEMCVRKCEIAGRSRVSAEQIARDYIGFFAAAYCDLSTRERVFRLYQTENPLDRYDRQRLRPLHAESAVAP